MSVAFIFIHIYLQYRSQIKPKIKLILWACVVGQRSFRTPPPRPQLMNFKCVVYYFANKEVNCFCSLSRTKHSGRYHHWRGGGWRRSDSADYNYWGSSYSKKGGTEKVFIQLLIQIICIDTKTCSVAILFKR